MIYRKILRRITAAVSAVLLFSGMYMTVSVMDGYKEGRKKYEKWRDAYTKSWEDETEGDCREKEGFDEGKKGGSVGSTGINGKLKDSRSEEKEIPFEAPERRRIDFEGLQMINEDIVGWIDFPCVFVSYPIVQGEDNQYYLHRSFEKQNLFAGCLFLDAGNRAGFEDENSIVYGHNMRDGSMFAALHQYEQKSKEDGVPYFWIYTPEQDCLFRIYSVHTAAEEGEEYRTCFEMEPIYETWMQKMRDSSEMEEHKGLKLSGKTVTLSTCTSDPGKRLVIQGMEIVSILQNGNN